LLIPALANDLNAGRLALILGAGVSEGLGLPDWGGLLDRLFASKEGAVRPAGLTPAEEADVFRCQYCGGDNMALLSAVRDALYLNFNLDFEQMRQNVGLVSIGALVMASRRGSVSQVVTFNYDDVLEWYLAYYGFSSCSVKDEQHWASNADVTVYHPHGFLPSPPSISFSKDIVFDQLAYDRIAGDETKIWHQVVLSILRSHVCLFIGLSGKDQNLRSLLARALDTHAPTGQSSFWGVVFMDSAENPMAGFWQDRGVYCKIVSDYSKALPKFLFSICQEAARLSDSQSSKIVTRRSADDFYRHNAR
jgi:hypothetical protein